MTTNIVPQETRLWVTVQEFADAMRVTKQTILQKVAKGQIEKIDLPTTTFAPVKGKHHLFVIPKTELDRCLQEIDIDALVKQSLDNSHNV